MAEPQRPPLGDDFKPLACAVPCFGAALVIAQPAVVMERMPSCRAPERNLERHFQDDFCATSQQAQYTRGTGTSSPLPRHILTPAPAHPHPCCGTSLPLFRHILTPAPAPAPGPRADSYSCSNLEICC
ncbi:unnamed protein product [Gadus morhua 'NCC']